MNKSLFTFSLLFLISCDVGFDLPENNNLTLKPETSGGNRALVVNQNSYDHFPVALHLDDDGSGLKKETEDEAYWKNYIDGLANKTTADFTSSLQSTSNAKEHRISHYLCLLGAGRKAASSTSVLSISVLDGCDGEAGYAWFEPLNAAADIWQQSYFAASFAYILEKPLQNSSTSQVADDVRTALSAGQFNTSKLGNFADSYFVTTKNGDSGFIYFQGSKEEQDWVSNVAVELSPVNWGGKNLGQVHGGYLKIVDAIWTNFKKSLQSMGAKNYTFVGYSKGGGVALLAGIRYGLETSLPVNIFSFGQPRISDKEFISSILSASNIHIYRISNDADVVVHLPPINEAAKLFTFLFSGR